MISRAFALFIGLLAGISLLGDLAWPGFDANIWLIRLDGLPDWMAKPILGTTAVTLMVFALRRPHQTARAAASKRVGAAPLSIAQSAEASARS